MSQNNYPTHIRFINRPIHCRLVLWVENFEIFFYWNFQWQFHSTYSYTAFL